MADDKKDFDILEEAGTEWKWAGGPSDNGLVLWKDMAHRTPEQRQKQHDEWDKKRPK